MESRSLHDVVTRALSRPGEPCYLLLELTPSDSPARDFSRITSALPWLPQLGPVPDVEIVCDDLHRYGLGVVACANEREARRLSSAICGSALVARLCQPPRPAPKVTAKERLLFGVYTTPPAVVGYLVRSVDRLLQERLGWSGLADPRVRLLDPAAGAMNFLRAAWHQAIGHHRGQGGEPRELLLDHLLPHSLGIERLAPMYAHGQRGLDRYLSACGVAPEDVAEMPTVLGDTLEPTPRLLAFPANVVLGHPPLRGSAISPASPASAASPTGWIDELLRGYPRPAGDADEGYLRVDGQPFGEANPKWLGNVAVRFLRVAQWKIDQAGEGVAALVLPATSLLA
jgi:hypothetical protein